MPDYYGVERSQDYLEHYGIKGMKWGVRKAVNQTGGPHSPRYHSIRHKLAMLSENRAINKVQKAQAHGRVHKVKRLYDKASEKLDELNKKADRNYQRGQYDQRKEDQSRMFWWSDNSNWVTGSGLKGNWQARALTRMDGRKSKKLISDKGHAKAVKERNDYAKQMAKMFSGTAYARQTKALAKKRLRVQK